MIEAIEAKWEEISLKPVFDVINRFQARQHGRKQK
jgi:hypothetical protein